MAVDYPGAQEHFVPRDFMFDSNAQKVIVIHKTGGDATPQAVYNTFLASGNPGNSVHYAIGTDGSIWQFVPEALGAGGNGRVEPGYDPFWQPYLNEYGNLNLCTFSIEHCDASDSNSTPVTPAQKEASFKLVAHLCQKYGIPASHIKTHASIDPVNRSRCPGNYPMSELIAYIQQGGTMPVPTGWKQTTVSGVSRLVAPNGHYLIAGFEQAVLDAPSWDAGNQPNEEEYTVPQVQLHNETLGAGSRVTTRDGVFWWTQAKGVVYEPYTGLELKACYDLIAAQHAEIAALKAAQPTPAPVDTAALVAAINAIPDGIAPLVASALIEAKKL